MSMRNQNRFGKTAISLMLLTLTVAAVPSLSFGQELLSTTGAGTAGNSAQTIDSQGLPVLLRAAEVTQDEDLGIIVARGGVEIARGENIILADTLSYNQNARTVTASGNVQVLEPSGDVIFAEYVELSDDFKEGTIENLRVLMADNARIAAAGARRINGTRLELARGVYTPCNVCAENPDSAPLWQVKADRVVQDKETQSIEYYDARMEIYGIPVAYLPFFTHPDPSVKRKSGFLFPSWGSKEATGAFARVPYFWAINDSHDVTFDPIYAEEQTGIFSGEYRGAFTSGQVSIQTSFTVADREVGDPDVEEIREDQFRGHVFSNGNFTLDQTWQAGWNVNRSTDKTYLRKFNFWTDPGSFMTSTAFLEGIRGRNHASARTFVFQDLRTTDESEVPLILPLIEYSGVGNPDSFGGRWTLDADIRGLTDEDDADSQRFSLTGGYEREFFSAWGLATKVTGSLRGDLYNVDHRSAFNDKGDQVEDGITGRLIPRLSAEMRYPLVHFSQGGRQVIEPIVALHAAPNGGNSPNIHNDDSSIFETDDGNVLLANRLGGLDRVETGQKAVAGVKLADYSDDGGRLLFFLGQSYRFSEDNQLRREVQMENTRSDWVGRVEIAPSEFFNATYQFNVQRDEFTNNRSAVTLVAGGAGFNISSRYDFVRSNFDPTISQFEQLQLGVSSRLSENWSVGASTLQDLRDESRDALEYGLFATYEDECIVFNTSFERLLTRGVDIEQEDILLFNVSFKTLGDVEF